MAHALAPYGWDGRVAERTQGFAEPGRVVRVEYGACVVRTATTEVMADWTAAASRTAGVNESPAVGDWVDVRIDDEEGPVVVGRAERWSTLSRHDPADHHTEQVLAANVDVIFVVASIDNDLNVRRLDRMLAMAWESGARPVLTLTKADLAEDGVPAEIAADVAGDAEWFCVNGLSGDGVRALRSQMNGGTAVFLGPSGVGKSTLVNALADDELMATGAVRDRDGKGRHTTTTRELWPVPSGVVIDTPGIRGVQLWDASAGVDRQFADLAELAASCRFGDCAHGPEPGCAVQAAVADGEISTDRVERWNVLRDEAVVWAERQAERDRENRRGRGRRRR